jgi:hypothetical protein
MYFCKWCMHLNSALKPLFFRPAIPKVLQILKLAALQAVA